MPTQVSEVRRSSNIAFPARLSSLRSRRSSERTRNGTGQGHASKELGRQNAAAMTDADDTAVGTTQVRDDLRSESRDGVSNDLCDPPLRTPPNRTSRNSETNQVACGRSGSESDVNYSVNVAVLGNESVGKSTFIQRTLDLTENDPGDPPSRILTVAGNLCVVRMFEMAISEVYRGEDDALVWPDRLGGFVIHGAMTLYDVGNKASFKLVPEVLNCINMMRIPSVLAACKCDISHHNRQLEPRSIEQRASSAFERITTLQTSESNNEPFRRAISAVLKNVVNQSHDQPEGAGPRRSTVPYLPDHMLPRRPPPPGHSRSTSEVQAYRAADPSSSHPQLGRKASNAASKNTSVSTTREDLSSFFVDESQTDDTASDTSRSADDTDASDAEPDSKGTPETPTEELGWTFDSLVNRLLALPTSKADGKFSAVFLALYRKFAPPGQLLEAVVVRFESVEHTEPVLLTRTVSQLRYLTVIEQWIHRYPGDFAHPQTLRRIRTFIAKLQKNRIFAAAAAEMSNHLDFVAEDDDTEWACCDKERKSMRPLLTSNEWSYRGSLLIDDPSIDFNDDDFGSLSLHPTGASNTPSDGASVTSLTGRRSNVKFEDIAQREAAKLVPHPRLPLTKNLWRQFYMIPPEHVAKEMTRMDYVMFSSIRGRDLVRHVSLSPTQKAKCTSLANVSRMIEHFNYVRDWVINYVLLRDKPKHRALMLEKFMHIARKLRELNNYNSLGAVLAGIKSTPVHRLHLTKDLVAPDVARDYLKLEILMAQTRSHAAYRLAWENSSAERIPYLPLPIRDLVGAESGNKTFVGGGGAGGAADEDGAGGRGPHARINWRKFEVMGDVLVGVQRAQSLPYKSSLLGPRNDDVQRLLLQTNVVRDDEILYERSVQLESGNAGGQDNKRGFKDFFKR